MTFSRLLLADEVPFPVTFPGVLPTTTSTTVLLM